MNGQAIYDEPAEIYFKRELDVASNSQLKIIGQQSAMHYHYYCTHPEEDKRTPAKDFGHALHTGILEPHQFERQYCVLPENAPNRPSIRQINAKSPSAGSIAQIDWWQRWDADHAGMIDLPAETFDALRGMADKARGHVLEIPTEGKTIRIPCGELFDMCRKEVTYRWTDARTGIKCKARTDLACDEFNFGGDLKSAVDASPDGFARAVHRYLYHQQHVHYTDGAQATGNPWSNFLFFAVEKEPPYCPAVYYIPAMAEELGRFLRDRALDRLKTSLETNTWPGYTNRMTELVLPAYAYYDAND